MPNGFIILAVKFVFVSSGWCPYVRISDDIITDEWVGEWVTRNGIVSCVFAFCEIITIITTWYYCLYVPQDGVGWHDMWGPGMDGSAFIHLKSICEFICKSSWKPLSFEYYIIWASGVPFPLLASIHLPLSLGECGGVDIIFCDSWNYLIKSQSHSIRAALLVNWTLPKCFAVQIFNVHQSCLLPSLLLLVNVLRNNNNNYWALN